MRGGDAEHGTGEAAELVDFQVLGGVWRGLGVDGPERTGIFHAYPVCWHLTASVHEHHTRAMKDPHRPIKAVDHTTTNDADEMLRLCRNGWLLVNTTVSRSVSGDGGFSDMIYYVLVEPAPES